MPPFDEVSFPRMLSVEFVNFHVQIKEDRSSSPSDHSLDKVRHSAGEDESGAPISFVFHPAPPLFVLSQLKGQTAQKFLCPGIS